MLDFLHTHHTGEDELLFPLLRKRTTLDPDLMDRMDAQHAQVDDTVTAVNAELPGWTATADPATGEKMAARIEATMPTLIDHLAEEEQKLLPVVSVTLTQSEWDALGKHSMSAIPLTRRLVILGHITEEADDAERQRFMQVIPAPARLAYKLIGVTAQTHLLSSEWCDHHDPHGVTRCSCQRPTSRPETCSSNCSCRLPTHYPPTRCARRYGAVRPVRSAATRSGVPCATIRPPSVPPPGPRSMT
ncbi:iron-sulfur cluster repair protein YtfE (RIC family) [Nocardia sp. GAS34]